MVTHVIQIVLLLTPVAIWYAIPVPTRREEENDGDIADSVQSRRTAVRGENSRTM
jgi:hypothetical protein